MASDDTNLPRVDAAIARQAARQYGNVTRRQLSALGLDSHAIARRAWLFPVHRGVYAVGRPPQEPLERAAAAMLACGPGAVMSHGSAMTLWGLWKRWETPFHISVPGDRRPPGIKVHRLRGLAARDIRRHLGFRVTSPARTLLDQAPALTEKSLTRRVNDARRAELLELTDLADVVERFPYHPGARFLKPFTETKGGPTRSEWEDAFPAYCKRHGLPEPLMNATVAGHEVDALFPEEKVIVELDSWEFHQDRASFESDRDRDADTLAAGHLTVRLTWQRMHQRAAREAARLHNILTQQRKRAA